MKVSGALPPRQEYEFETPVPDPLQFIGAALVQTLSTAGIKVDGGARLARTSDDRAGGQPLTVVKNPLARSADSRRISPVPSISGTFGSRGRSPFQ